MRKARLTAKGKANHRYALAQKRRQDFECECEKKALSWLHSIDNDEKLRVIRRVSYISLLEGKARQKARRKLNQSLPPDVSFSYLLSALPRGLEIIHAAETTVMIYRINAIRVGSK